VAEEDISLRLLVYKACLAAVWSDDSMSGAERRHLGSLIEQLAESEEERGVFRRHSLAEISGEFVLDQVAELGEREKRAVFESCLAVLGSDKHLNGADLKFLARLRKSCGIGFFSFHARLWRLRREGVRLGSRKRKAALAIFALIAGASLMATKRGDPREQLSGREVLLPEVALQDEPAGKGLEPEWVYRFTRDSFATVEVMIDGVPKVRGSASLIGYDRSGGAYLLTNRHVVAQKIKPGETIEYLVLFWKNAKYGARLDFMSKKFDLALLYLPALDPARPALPLRPRAALGVGQRVYAIGSPHDLKHSFTGGLISAMRDDYLQTDATADHGSSGGPLVDASGRLCGVMTKAHKNKNFSFAHYADHVLEALQERRLRAGRLKP